MKKSTIINLLSAATFLAMAFPARAQEKQYDDLLVKYVDEKYEECITKAERYTEADNTTARLAFASRPEEQLRAAARRLAEVWRP